MRAEAFIIHLARARGRAPQVERLRAGLPMPVTVIDAVDAMALPEHEAAAVYRPKLHRPHYPFALRKTEIACFLSHRNAWRRIVESGLDGGLVVEDDVEVDRPRFAEALDLALARAQPMDFVRFPMNRREHGQTVAQAGQARLITPERVGLGMQAQLVGREAARRLLELTERFDRPVDTTIQMRWLHDVRVLTTLPLSIRDMAISLGGTTVQRKEMPFVENLKREINRARYRLALRTRVLAHSRTGEK